MAEVDRQADLRRILAEEQAVKVATEARRAAEAEKLRQQAEARRILDQKR